MNNQNNFNDHLTLEELNLVFKLMNLLHNKNIDYDEEMFDQNYLIRFLRSKNLNLKEAFIMFTNFLKWHEKQSEENEGFDFVELPEILKHHPHGLHKIDKLGRPIYIEVWGKVDFSKVIKNTSHERLQKYYITRHENLINNILPKCSKIANKYVGQMCLIIDIRDFSLSQINTDLFKMIEKRSDNYEQYYPDLLGRCNIVSNSLGFKAIWTIVSAFLSENTKKRVNFYTDDYQNELCKIIEPENLPVFLGGKCDCNGGCLAINSGPWKEL